MVEPEETLAAKLRAAARYLTYAAEGRLDIEEAILDASTLCAAVLQQMDQE